MNMNQRAPDQLEKILALADSDHEGEALGALRMARRLMARDGLNFADLAAAAAGKTTFSFKRAFFSPSHAELEAKIEQLQDDLCAHVEQNSSLTAQIDFWRRRSFELEQLLNLNQAETARWKEMARETAERLWDLGKLTQDRALEAVENVIDDQETEQDDALKAAS